MVEYRQAATPAPFWRGIDRIELRCSTDRDGLCGRFAERARIGAPMPVATTAETPTLATLHLIVAFGPADQALSLTVAAERPVPIDDAQGSLLPRRFAIAPGETDTQFLDRVLDAVLPWRHRRGPRRME